MSSISAVIEHQNELFGLITRAFDNLNKLGAAKITKGKIRSRLDTLDSNWNKFQSQHQSLLKVKTDNEDNQYFKSNLYFNCEEQYNNVKGEILDLLDEITKKNNPEDVSISQSLSSNRNYNLPKIELPKFSGNYTHWSNFRDMFSSMVKSNNDLSGVEKLHYLKTSLSDEPAQLLKNIAVCSDNFQHAWDLLVSRYENKRILIDSRLSSLFNARSIKQETSNEMKRLIGQVKESMGALETLGCPVKHWDHILVFMVVHKFDIESLKDWEKSIGDKTTSATFSQLETFITGRIHALEAIEQISGHRKPASNVVPSRILNQVKTHVSQSLFNCSCCKGDHYITSCQQYLNKPVAQRKEFVMSKSLCFNCLGPHLLKHCKTQKRCKLCQKQHHTTLHNNQTTFHQKLLIKPSSSQQETISPTSSELISSQSCMAYTHVVCNKSVLLATAMISIITDLGERFMARALIDQGSEVSFVAEAMVQLLNISRSNANIPIVGIGAQKAGHSRGVINLNFSSHSNPDQTFSTKALVLKKLTSYLSPKHLYYSNCDHLKNIPLADPNYSSQEPIEVILGADIYAQIIENGIRKGDVNAPIAQKTQLGWILSGPVNNTRFHSPVHGFQCTLDVELKELIQRFWLQEQPETSTVALSKEESDCEECFQNTYQRNSEGRFIVRLPFKTTLIDLGDSYTPASKVLFAMENRFKRNSSLKSEYLSFMKEYHDLGHMIKLPHDQSFCTPHFFLPHHGVIKETSTTTKLRVVFNGSQKTSLGESLNDNLHIGPKLQNDLSDILMRWRRYQFVFTADIEKMYRQIIVHPNDRKFQQILWRDCENQPLSVYQLATVTYGLACAPYLAIRCLKELSTDCIHDSPLARADDLETIKAQILQIDNVLKSAGFVARKWMSNNNLVLNQLSKDQLDKDAALVLDTTSCTLGLRWDKSERLFPV
ncbi:uncharacterized protein [Onthophagus taurus]|uniref:uncharacterized protein n=1 Tax=Onthophagus taurus TaxID=166361 RepID=UPI0039BE8FDB